MRAVVQRVRNAHVDVDGRTVGRIGAGLVVLLGIAPDDGDEQVAWLSNKVANLRVFADREGRMNRSLLDVGGGALVVSQFTLYGDCRRGRRPSFVGAARPEQAEPTYLRFCEHLASVGVDPVQRGVFGALMDVTLVNDGPVTLIMDTPDLAG